MSYLGQAIVPSTLNTSTTPLTNGSTFTGTGELNGYNDVMVYVKTDQNGVLYVEFSPNGTDWDTSLSFNYDTDRINPPHIFEKGYRYFRVRFTNDSGSDQTYFRLNTDFGNGLTSLTSPINGTVSENYDALNVRPTEYKYEVAMGKRQGRNLYNKFGYNSDIDSGTEEIIAAFGGTWGVANIMTTAGTLDVVSSSTNDSSAGTGARTVLISGLDANQLSQTETVTMNGITPVTTSNSWLGVNRVVVLTSGSSAWNEGDITISDTAATYGTQASIPTNNSVTQQCLFHVQTNHKGLTDWLMINSLKLSGAGGSPRLTIKAFVYNRGTATIYEVFREDMDTNVENSIVLNPSHPFVLNAGDVFWLAATTNTNNTVVNGRFSLIEERIS